MSFTQIASAVPAPFVPTAPPSQSGCTDTTTTAQTAPPMVSGQSSAAGSMCSNYNKLLAQIAAIAGYGGVGYGVIDGLAVTLNAGLLVNIASGHAAIMGIVEYPGGTQVAPDNSTCFLWLLQNGTATVTTTTAPPVANCLYVCNFVTAGGVAGSFDYSGVVYLRTGVAVRQTADRCVPSDTPDATVRVQTITKAGTFHWDGARHRVAGVPAYSATLAGTLTLGTLDVGFFVLDPNGSNRTVLLPASPNIGDLITIVNSAHTGASSVIVKDSTGTTTICTLTNGQSSGQIQTVMSGGVAAYSTQAVTPVSD